MDDEKLIAAVRAREFIYSKTDKNHSNRDMVCSAWENIAREVGNNVTSTACRSRWASLRDHFRRKHKELTTTQSGQAANKKRKWYLYDFLTFLIPSCSSGATSGNLSQNVAVDDDGSTSSNDEFTHNNNSPLSVQSTETTHSAPKQPAPAPRNQARGSGKRSSLSAVDREVLQALSAPEKEAGDNEMFFKSLLPVMKTFDTVETLELRSEIQSLVLSHVKAKANRASIQTSQEKVVASSQASASHIDDAMYRMTRDSQNAYYTQDQYFSHQPYQ